MSEAVERIRQRVEEIVENREEEIERWQKQKKDAREKEQHSRIQMYSGFINEVVAEKTQAENLLSDIEYIEEEVQAE